ncbi:helix-turn-helix transcriptional regulator [Actinotalea sp. BY-33]|uniref:Helix-turn-helix transcriptional regulator n=1 Tax=Actinotalea soli TaxID=2819234 RepID=A0A939LN67_9CELL|nr:helix-turn-helix domain-containing protein [Actinotalea soli]MBO1750996.1 helix-turn-helix transcriptional regulator [Actinotalea soli]
MNSSERPAITDPERIRALAHPLRMDLLDFLDESGEATATQCAGRTGETVANCSFHLRTLAKAGFIEPAEPRGREKPWRPVSTGGRRLDVDPENPASLRAIGELVGLTVLREADRIRDFMARQHEMPADWQDTVTVTTASFWATPDEMRELVNAVNALAEPFRGRHAAPETRPDGARPGRLFAVVNPEELAPPATQPEQEQ